MSVRVAFRCNLLQAEMMDRVLDKAEATGLENMVLNSDQERASLKSGHRQLKRAIASVKEKLGG